MANDLLEKTNKFSMQVENIVRIVKHGRREQVLFLIGFLCLGIANIVPTVLKNFLETVNASVVVNYLWLLNVVSIVPFAWGFVRIWKKASPSRMEIPDTVKPSAIKGPFAFGEMDGPIFAQLGRKADISKLLGWVLDEQICFTALLGESGAGKTSLLRAGLMYTLLQEKEKYGITPVYWEARSENALDDLLRAVQAACPEDKAKLESVDDLLNQSEGVRKVIIIDQAEQLSPEKHPEIFQLFSKIAAQKPPYTTTWIIAFRREYASTWIDFECTQANFHPPKHSLRLFSAQQAQDVMAVLAAESGLSPDAAVLAEMIRGMSEEGKVSPVEIGIGMMVLSELYNAPAGDISLGSFRQAGGVTGLLRTYMREKFENGFPEHEQSGMEKALLGLIDPKQPQQRLAAGKSASDLAALAQLPMQHIQHNLDYLASSAVRILEKLPDGKYRLAHERLIAALESLTRELLAAAEQANRLLHERHQIWLRAKQTRFLLSGRELRQVLKYKSQFQDQMNPELRRYINDSRRRRNRLIAAGLTFVIFLMLLPTANTIVLEPLLRSHRIKQVPAQFVEIPGGTFVMGDSSKYSEENEQPVHPVSLAGFRMSRYEITNQQYCDFLNSYETTADSVEIWIDMHSTYCQIMQEEKEFSVRSGYKDHPVATISWYGAHAYARWLSEQFEGSYRLPTEAEWEYACRAGTKTQFNTGDSLTTDQANFQGERYIGNTIAVGSFLENAWGLYNMHGNVWEWCQDEWHVNYEGAPKDGRAWQTGEGSRRVLRGGGWSNYAQYCRSAYRSPIDPGIRIIAVGFRLVFVPQ